MPQTLNYNSVKSLSGSGTTPVGSILPWSKSTPPPGFLKCDGSAVSRTTYSALFDVIGTDYGSGDGSTTFNLPNLTSRSAVGANTSTNVAQTGGAVDTTGAGFTLQNNLTTGSFNNLALQVTQNLGVSTTENLAIQTTENLAGAAQSNVSGSITDNLSIGTTQNLSASVSGSVSNHTLTLAQITAHNHPGSVATQSLITNPPNVNPDGAQNSSVGSSGSDQAHNHGHNIAFNVTGNASGAKSGSVAINTTGTVATNLTGNVSGAKSGSVVTNVTGNVSGNLTGNVTANITGDVTAQNTSLYSPHVVVIYIIKH